MNIIYTDDFQKNLGKLPKQIIRLFKIQEKRFQLNWHDPRLHVKKIRSLEYAFSLRITRRYRIFFYFQNKNTAIFFDIDHCKDIYK